MYGLQAILENNGWAISAVGITIVFTGLVLLSIFISQLHKFLDLWENKKEIKKIFKKEKTKSIKRISVLFTETHKDTAQKIYLIVQTMEKSFSLSKLLWLAKTRGLERPHSNLNNLLKAGIIMPDNKGYYIWNMDMFKKIIRT
ncbi:MAG: hypothetical protein B6I26_02900 [Desulfobacteraceae bacterium 4572_130]|nr:MAG: hypothetical protein B6I26_02900 [Desulfobacteraceae bacterium 4572_130]